MSLLFLLGLIAILDVAGAAWGNGRSVTEEPKSTSSAASPAVPTHPIAVGADGFKFTPNEINNAAVGDIIEFRFYPGGHTVARAEFEYPCIPYEYTGPNKVGFFSGQISPQVISNDLPSFQVRVNDTNPVFFYCAAPGSCIKEHMVGVVNPSANETLDIQMDFTANATTQLAPGDPFPSESADPTHTPTSVVPASGRPNSDDGSHLGGGAIAGITIGAAAVLVLAGTLAYLSRWRLGMSREYSSGSPVFDPRQRQASMAPSRPSTTAGTDSLGGVSPLTSHRSVAPGSDDALRAQSPRSQYLPSLSPLNGTLQPTYIIYPSSSRHIPSIHLPPIDTSDNSGGNHAGEHSTPTPIVQTPQGTSPAELPASNGSELSPPPQYREGRYSWVQGAEQHYRPGDKS